MFKHYLRNHIDPNRILTKEMAIILLYIFTYSLGFSCVFFLPLYLKDGLNYSIHQVGIILSIFGVGFIIGSFLGGKLCDKFSSYKISIISISSYLLSTLAVYYIQQPKWVVSIALSILGCAVATFSPASRISLMNLTPSHERARINGVRYMIFNVGCALSYGIAGFIAHGNYRNIFVLSALSSVITLLILLPLKQKNTTPNKVLTKTKVYITREKFLLIYLLSFFLGTLIYNQIGSSYSLFLSTHYHLTAHALGILFFLNSFMVAFFQVGLLNKIQNISEYFLMSIGSFVFGIGFFILLFGNNFGIAVISMIIITLGEMLFMPASYTLIFQNAKEEVRGFYMGIYQALIAATFILSPLLGTFLLAENPSGTILWSISLLICFIPLLCFFMSDQRRYFAKS